MSPSQTVFQVSFGPSFLNSEFVHLCRSSAETGGWSFATHTLDFWTGRAIGAPVMDIWVVTSQKFPMTFAGSYAAASSETDPRRTNGSRRFIIPPLSLRTCSSRRGEVYESYS